MPDEFDLFESQFTCPVCGSDQIVPAIGNKNSPILIVGEYPGEEELKYSKPMVGPMGTVLRQELSYLGFDIKSARRTNLWRHPPNTSPLYTPPKSIGINKEGKFAPTKAPPKQLSKQCLQDGIEEVIKDARGKKAILLLGDETVKIFLDKPVTKIAGLLVKSNYFSAKIVVACPNPAMMFHAGKGVGEVRLALKKFVGYLEEYGITTSSKFDNSDWDTD